MDTRGNYALAHIQRTGVGFSIPSWVPGFSVPDVAAEAAAKAPAQTPSPATPPTTPSTPATEGGGWLNWRDLADHARENIEHTVKVRLAIATVAAVSGLGLIFVLARVGGK